MSTCTAAAVDTSRRMDRAARSSFAEVVPLAPRRGGEGPAGRAIALLDRGLPREADELLTVALLDDGRDPDLWMIAGIARLRRGATQAARAAFEMCAWLSDDPLARKIAAML